MTVTDAGNDARRARLLLAHEAATILGAVVVGGFALYTFEIPSWGSALFFAALCILAEYFAIRLPYGGAVSLTSALALAAVLTGGPATGAVVAAIGSFSLADVQDRKPWSRMVFNTAQYVLATVMAGFTLVLAGVQPLALAGSGAPSGAHWVLAALAAAVVLAAVNAALVGTAVAISTRSPLSKVLAEFFGWYAVSVIALALLGLVMAELLYVAGVMGTLLIVVPFTIARQTFEVFQRQSAAYRETVRSLVTAIEAKDAYTRGHSERVAWYARLICERLRLPEPEQQRIEWAALLHDIGKVALDSEMLCKPGALSPTEYSLVREHPTRAAEILAGIEFLEDSVPYIQAHHERIDGGGYPCGVQGAEIPLGARVLAVADSFDAMTSSRAYRDALTYEHACLEMRTMSGVQFDPECVSELLAAINSETVDRLLESREWASQWTA